MGCRARIGALIASGLLSAGGAPALAGVPASLHSPESCERITAEPGYAFIKCDDGVPQSGGTTPNEGGEAAVTVPAKYRGYAGLPAKALGAGDVPGADSKGRIGLDVDVSLPAVKPPRRGYPLLFMMHGCCAGNKTSWEAESFDGPDATVEKWHYSNAWFAARGYAVVTYTSRGFVNGQNRGSTGQTELDSRAYEVNDYQSLACQMLRSASSFADVAGHRVQIDPRRVVTTGGSYGGGFSWMALTDPKWRCGSAAGGRGRQMSLRVTAPKYGWTDLAYSLVPTGRHLQGPGSLPSTRGCDSASFDFSGKRCAGSVVGLPKRSIVAGLYASGKTGVPPGSSHTTFPPKIDEAISCLNAPYPPDSSPACTATVSELLPEFMRERSAYYQNRFFRLIRKRPAYRIPVFNAATFTDPLFTSVENRRMLDRLRRAVPGYPIQSYHGDYQHFSQNKAKEWADLCAGDHHVCAGDDYRPDVDRAPASRRRIGVTSMLNDFIDHFARPQTNARERRPRFNVTAALQICPENASSRYPADEPGRRFRAPTFERLAPRRLRLSFGADQTTTSKVIGNPHAQSADPVNNQVSNGARCPVENEPAGEGVAVYTGDPLAESKTMIGATRVAVELDASMVPPEPSGLQLNARLYDVFPDGRAVLVDRGPRRLTAREIDAGSVTYELHGNGWRFPSGHSIRIELAQDDEPFLRASDVPSSLTLEQVRLSLPVR
ncbi:MAG: hypothetical protein H0W09_07020 [Solirubrobacterales bacterium]|nr:hypothetical protein [Solirubrobacterales bacterium]